MAFQLKELDGTLGDVVTGITDKKPMILWKNRYHSYQVWLKQDFLHIEDLHVKIIKGVFYKYSHKEDGYVPEREGYFFLNQTTGRLLHVAYDTDLITAVRAFVADYKNYDGDVEELSCIYTLDNGRFIRKRVLTRTTI